MKQLQSNISQKLDVALSFGVEFYRSAMAAFLVIFVPQKCGDDLCEMLENMFMRKGILYSAAASLNIVTFISFSYLYYVEIHRENKLIEYLEMNPELAKDDETMRLVVANLDQDRQDELYAINRTYHHAGYFAMLSFAANTAVSAIPIVQNSIDLTTFTVLITNVLYNSTKLLEVYAIVSADKNVFYSAYLTERQQFNDIDPDIILEVAIKNAAIQSSRAIELLNTPAPNGDTP